MYTETINKIKSMMESELQPMQMKKLDEVLHKVFAERAASGSSKKEKRNLIKQGEYCPPSTTGSKRKTSY